MKMTPEQRSGVGKVGAAARWKLHDLRPEAIATLQKVGATATDPKLRARAFSTLQKHGVPFSSEELPKKAVTSEPEAGVFSSQQEAEPRA